MFLRSSSESVTEGVSSYGAIGCFLILALGRPMFLGDCCVNTPSPPVRTLIGPVAPPSHSYSQQTSVQLPWFGVLCEGMDIMSSSPGSKSVHQKKWLPP